MIKSKNKSEHYTSNKSNEGMGSCPSTNNDTTEV